MNGRENLSGKLLRKRKSDFRIDIHNLGLGYKEKEEVVGVSVSPVRNLQPKTYYSQKLSMWPVNLNVDIITHNRTNFNILFTYSNKETRST